MLAHGVLQVYASSWSSARYQPRSLCYCKQSVLFVLCWVENQSSVGFAFVANWTICALISVCYFIPQQQVSVTWPLSFSLMPMSLFSVSVLFFCLAYHCDVNRAVVCLANALLMSLSDRWLIADWTVRKCGVCFSCLSVMWSQASCVGNKQVKIGHRIKLNLVWN